VTKANSDSLKHIYNELNTKEGEAKIYKIAKARQRKIENAYKTQKNPFVAGVPTQTQTPLGAHNAHPDSLANS